MKELIICSQLDSDCLHTISYIFCDPNSLEDKIGYWFGCHISIFNNKIVGSFKEKNQLHTYRLESIKIKKSFCDPHFK